LEFMGAKSPTTILSRFSGTRGRERLIEALCIQPCVAGDQKLASQLSRLGKLCELKGGTILTTQGDADNDLFFVISGEVSIAINGRAITSRKASQHVGEMSMLDPTARRSATVTASEETLVFRIAEREITKIAADFPELWRRMAVELASRLRERSKLISPLHATPVIFVGSSSEGLAEAEWITDSLNRRAAVSRLWTQGVFQLSKTTIENLLTIAGNSDFAVLVLTPDDITASRGRKQSSPRDNVVFELGLFMGELGRERTFVVMPAGKELKLPTDLLGVTRLQYQTGSKKTAGRRLKSVSQTLWRHIQELGPK
jgi:CRP/FNR family transcriptional regulator, cyclic AMP receptor protein